MAQSPIASPVRPGRGKIRLIYEIFFCAFSLVNVLFVLFDFTYLMGVPYTNITFRDIYLQKLPPLLDRVGVRTEYRTFITDAYDPVKDIIPHRTTDRYLNMVALLEHVGARDASRVEAFLKELRNDLSSEQDDLQNDLRNDRRKTIAKLLAGDDGIPGALPDLGDDYKEVMTLIQENPGAVALAITDDAAEVEDRILADLRRRSVALIDESPFEIARKNGTLEVLKREIRGHVKERLAGDQAELARIGGSAKKSFDYFWSRDVGARGGNLTAENFAAELAWFQTTIRPLMEQNYFRHIGDDGELQNEFYRLDLFFVAVFAIDFLARWIMAIYNRRYRKWYLFPVTRWFEVFNLLLPHHWAWLRLGRIIPLVVRLRENGFIPGEGILPGLVRDNATIIAEEISGLVLLQILKQARTVLHTTDIAELLEKSDKDEQAIAEIQKIVDTQTQAIAHGMVPAIFPGVADLVRHSIDKSLEPWLLSPVGGPLRLIMISIHKSVRDGLAASMVSDEGRDQMAAIMKRSTQAIFEEMTSPKNVSELQKNLDHSLGNLIDEIEIYLKEQNKK